MAGATDFFKRANKALENEAAKMGGVSGNSTETPQGNTGNQPTGGEPATARPQEQNAASARSQPPIAQTQSPAAPQEQNAVPASGAQNAAQAAAPPEEVADTPEQIAMRYLKEQGISVSNISELQSAMNRTEGGEESEEQKKRREQQKEQKLLNTFLEKGGTMDDFYRLRKLKEVKDEDFMREKFHAQMREFNPDLDADEIDDVFNRQYFIGADGEYNEHEQKYGRKRLTEEAQFLRTQESEPLSVVEHQMQLDEAASQSHKEWEKLVDTWSAQMPRKIDIPIGKMGDNDLGNFSYTLSEDEQRDMLQDLKNPNHLLEVVGEQKDGKFTKKTDLNKLHDLLLWKRFAQKMIKAAASENYSKGIETVSAGLNNYPDLKRNGQGQQGQSASDDVQAGVNILKRDAQSIMGRRQPIRKPLVS